MKNGLRLAIGMQWARTATGPSNTSRGRSRPDVNQSRDVLVQVKVRALDFALATHSGPDREVRAAAW
jgi:hypothetical protein